MAEQYLLNDIISSGEGMQFALDTTEEQFDTPVWPRYGTSEEQESLDWKDIQGKMEQVSAATMIDYSAPQPEFTRPTLSTLQGKLATFGNKYTLSPEDILRAEAIERSMARLAGSSDGLQIINFLYPELNRLIIGPHKSIDMLLLEGLSKGTMTMDKTNNPLGITMSIDWGIDTAKVETVWSDTAATPITDIKNVLESNDYETREFVKIMMSRSTFNQMIRTTEFSASFGFEMTTTRGKVTTPKVLPGLELVNQFFSAADLPMIEIVNDKISIEGRDGEPTYIRPFADSRVTFVTTEDLMKLPRTLSKEERMPDARKTYAKSNDVSLATLKENGEISMASSFVGFPILTAAKTTVIMKTDEAA